MSMLAEQKKKKRWTINPRGTLWTNDENKFGQKLLEKMGWSKGKGLGKEEQGCKEPIRVSMNEEQKGVGYKGKSDLEWTKHYDAFEDILSNLNSLNSNINDTTYEEKESVKVVESLEKKSKVSKSRVHYHKFTRGKDLSRYNDDDLACVLGSKRLKPKITEIEVAQQIATPLTETEIGKTDKSHGLTTVHGGNLKEYFSQKMTELKRKRGEGIIGYTGNTDQNNEEINDISFPNLEFEPEKLSFSFNVSQSINETAEEGKIHCSTKIKKSKRKEKTNTIEEVMEPDNSTITINSKNQKKDTKNRKLFNEEILIEETDHIKKKSPKESNKLEKFSAEENCPKTSKKKEKILKKSKENEESIEDIDTIKCKNFLKSELKVVSTQDINADCPLNIATENLGDTNVPVIKRKKNKKKKSKLNLSDLDDSSLKVDCVGDADYHDIDHSMVVNQSKELNESYGIAMSVMNDKKRKHKEGNCENGAPTKKIKKLTSELNLGELFKSSSSLIPCDEATQGKSLPGKKIKLSAKKSFKELKSGMEAKLKRIKEIYNEHELQQKETKDDNVNISNMVVSEKESNKGEKDMTTIHSFVGKTTSGHPKKFVVNMNDLFPGSNWAEIKGYD